MEISDLLGRLKGSEKDNPKPFLALELTDEVVVAAVWQVEDGKTNIVALGTPVEWDGDKADSDELIKAVDATISTAIEGLSGEPNEIIFGVVNSWTNEQGVLPDKLQLLKSVSKELELKPLGFVVVTDSLLRYLKMQEGTPTTSILVQVAQDTVTVSLVKLGKIEGTETIGRSDDISADVEEGLSRFKSDGELPSRILVFNSMHSLEEEVQNLISYDWKNKFNFLHIPKIESLPKDVLIRSIAVAGGMEVAKAIGFNIAEEPEQGSPPTTENIQEESNVVAVEPTVTVEHENDQDVDELLSAQDFGFSEIDKKPRPPIGAPVASVAPAAKITLTPDVEQEEPEDKPITKAFSNLKLPAIRFPKFNVKIPTIRGLPHMNTRKLGLPAMIGIAALLILGVGGASAIWLVPRATVTVYVEPKSLEENVDLILSTTATSIDESSATVPAQLVEKVVTGEESVETTGKKTIGDPAKGEVVVYNRTGATKTFAKGSTLAAGALKFTFDESVTVASKSAGSDYVDVPGKATAKITAKAIGTESNLASGTEFVIESFAKDTYVAKNDKALSGGTSQEVRVVDKVDKTAVSQALLVKLREQGKQELLAELGGGLGVYVLEEGSKLEEENYSADVGEEASSLTASYKLSVKGVSYSTHNVETLMASEIEKAMPAGYKRTIDAPTVELGDAKSESEESIEVQAKIIVKLLPTVDEKMVQQSLRGAGSSEIEQNLGQVIGFKGASVEITPKWLPPRFKRMPRNPNNISVAVVSAQQ